MEDGMDFEIEATTEDRPRGVSKAKLADVELDSKISIFYRPHRNAAMVTLESSFPREAALIFCDRIYSELGDNSDSNNSKIHSYIITGGEQVAYQRIFAWINDCVQTQSIEKFPEIPEPEDDPFSPTIDIIVAAERLGVPAGSLTYHLKKRLVGCARKHLMPFSQVYSLYDIESNLYDLGLKHIACTSIFNAWWEYRLDASINPESMEELYDMRDHIKELDDDLHESCRTREAEVRKKWAEKKAKKEAERAGGDCNDHENFEFLQEDTNANGGWDKVGAVSSSNLWDPNTYNSAQNGKTFEENEPPTGPQQSASQTWADEMNDPVPVPVPVAPLIQW